MIRIEQEILLCAKCYQDTYNTRSVEEMNKKKHKFNILMETVSLTRGIEMEELIERVSDTWMKKYR